MALALGRLWPFRAPRPDSSHFWYGSKQDAEPAEPAGPKTWTSRNLVLKFRFTVAMSLKQGVRVFGKVECQLLGELAQGWECMLWGSGTSRVRLRGKLGPSTWFSKAGMYEIGRNQSSVAFCSPAKSLTFSEPLKFSGLMESP